MASNNNIKDELTRMRKDINSLKRTVNAMQKQRPLNSTKKHTSPKRTPHKRTSTKRTPPKRTLMNKYFPKLEM